MALTPDEAVQMAGDQLIPAWRKERRKYDMIDRWARWHHDAPHRPRQATQEYRELAARAQAPWGALVVTSVAQTLFVEGYRRPDQPDDATGWDIWQANQFDARQGAIHRAALTYGLAYATAIPGETLTGDPMPVLRGESPREFIALYDDPANDEWPETAIKMLRQKNGSYRVTVYDDTFVHELGLDSIASTPAYKEDEQTAHGAGRCPVVRYANRFDLEGRSAGEIEPFIPLLGRIDQTVFDRLVVQRFASWIVRTVAGMDLSKSAQEANLTLDQAQLLLKVNDLLVAQDPDTKFGSLPATPMDGFISAEERDLTDLAAVSQTPAFELLGQMANMSAEALAAAKASQTAKASEAQHQFGESHEQLIRLGCHILGDSTGASDFRAQVRWADTSIRSLAQAADALGKLATMLGFPPELLWSKIPGFTQQDVDEGKKLLAKEGGMDALLARLEAARFPAASNPAPPPALPAPKPAA